MLVDATQRHRPARIEDVMNERQEKSPETNAQEEHEREQIGVRELGRQSENSDGTPNRSDDGEDHGQLLPKRRNNHSFGGLL